MCDFICERQHMFNRGSLPCCVISVSLLQGQFLVKSDSLLVFRTAHETFKASRLQYSHCVFWLLHSPPHYNSVLVSSVKSLIAAFLMQFILCLYTTYNKIICNPFCAGKIKQGIPQFLYFEHFYFALQHAVTHFPFYFFIFRFYCHCS